MTAKKKIEKNYFIQLIWVHLHYMYIPYSEAMYTRNPQAYYLTWAKAHVYVALKARQASRLKNLVFFYQYGCVHHL